jgi:DNA-binding IclR family transcriptional regulator
MTTDAAATGTQAVDRAALLLSTVVKAEGPITSTELADECGLPRSTTSRLLTALERTDLLGRTDLGFVAGPVFWRWASRHDPWRDVVRRARSVLEHVGEATGETAILAAARGDRVVHLAQVDSTYVLGTRDWTRIDVPAHVSALGKVLLAEGPLVQGHGEEELERLTDHTVADPEDLRRELVETRRRGWGVAVDELEVGLAGVAVPLRVKSRGDRSVELVGALGVSGPTARLDGRLEELAVLLQEQAAALAAVLNRHRPTKEGVR